MNILEKNRIIAEFMTDEPEVLAMDLKRAGTLESMQYHSDWNWLMQVVEKIESLGISVNIKATWNNFHNCTHTQTSIKKEKGEFGNSKQCFWVHDIVYHGHSDTKIKKIDSVYEAVYQFVVWHNQQQKL